MAENRLSVTDYVEYIFSHAAALAQESRLQNTIYCLNRCVYILNQDYTVLLQFRMRPDVAPFAFPVSFRANDYASKEFVLKEGKIEFVTRGPKWTSVKSCGTPDRTPEEVQNLYRTHTKDEQNIVVIDKDVIPILSQELSHLEISGKAGKLTIIQRNIYDGTIITHTPKVENTLTSEDNFKDFGPVGIRTQDFIALYSFVDRIKWRFTEGFAWFESQDQRMRMTGIVSQCLYDELGRSEDGRQEQENRTDQQSPDRQDQKPRVSVTVKVRK